MDCTKCIHGYDASSDGNNYGPIYRVQGCHLGYLPEMGYPCKDRFEEAQP